MSMFFWKMSMVFPEMSLIFKKIILTTLFSFGKWVTHYRYFVLKNGDGSLQENRTVVFQKMGIIIS